MIMDKKKQFLIGIIIILIAIIIFLGYINQKGVIPFETVAKGEGLGSDAPYEPLYTVLTNEDELNQFLDKFGPFAREVINFSENDFKNYILICAYFGKAPRTGYEIEIKKIVQKQNLIEITVSTKEPKYGLDMETNPYHVVKVKKDYLKGKLTFIFRNTDGKELSEMVKWLQ